MASTLRRLSSTHSRCRSESSLATGTTFTWRAPSLAAAKGSYLLPLVVPAGIFFARGVAGLEARLRSVALAVSAAAAVVAAIAFTSGLVFPAEDPRKLAATWTQLGSQLPDSYVTESVTRLLAAR